jgi:hypothetical protein
MKSEPQVCLIPRGPESTMTAECAEKQPKGARMSCTVANCNDSSAAVLDDQALCLEHFFARCYQALEGYDGRRVETHWVEEMESAQLRRFLEECSTQALKVCLGNENLNNLQRGRLLDVLLWAGELSECVSAAQIRLGRVLEQGDVRGAGSREMPSGS